MFSYFGAGFKNAKNLASLYTSNNGDSKYDPLRNADSNSLFALGTWIIVQHDGGPIGEDGTFNKPQATPKARI